MAVALGYGVYMFFRATPNKGYFPRAGKDIDVNKVQSVLVQVTRELDLGDLSEVEEYAIGRAEEGKMWGWRRDPFLEDPEPFVPGMAVKIAEAEEKASFRYSGYLEVENRKMAIIDGFEYQIGEKLAAGGHVLRAIYPDRVVLEKKIGDDESAASQGQAGIKISVPLVEW